MPPRLRRLSAREVVQILEGIGFQAFSQRGSHMKLRRITSEGHRQTLTVPIHSQLDIGTLRAIFRQASRFIPEEELREHFYSE